MRHLDDFSNFDDAKFFGAYLASQGIEVLLREEGIVWGIWIRHEAQVEAAREHWAQYLRDPEHETFQRQRAAWRDRPVGEAESALNLSEPATYVRRVPTMRELSRQAPLTMCVLWLAFFVALATDFGTDLQSATMRSLTFCNPVERAGEAPQAADPLRDIRSGELWRLVTPIVIHFGWLHFAFSTLLFFQFGWHLETRRSSGQLGWVLLVTGSVGNMAQFLLSGATLFATGFD